MPRQKTAAVEVIEAPKPTPKRGRPAANVPPVWSPAIASEQVTTDLAISDADQSRLAQIDATYSDNLPYSRDRIEGEIRVLAAQTAAGMLEIGKRLTVLKEHEAHGEFMASVNRLGINGAVVAPVVGVVKIVQIVHPVLIARCLSPALNQLCQRPVEPFDNALLPRVRGIDRNTTCTVALHLPRSLPL